MVSTDTNAPVFEALTQLHDLIRQFRTEDARGSARLAVTGGRIADAAEQLVDLLQIRAYAPDGHADDRLEQVVVSRYGVDLSIRGREGDLFVHVDSTDRDTDDADTFPLVLEVNSGGENEYQ